MRYERKFPSRQLSSGTLEQLIRQHPVGFRKAYPDRQINNIYFDTPQWRTFYENLAGVSVRTKYRVRWYGLPDSGINNARFELKKKENLLGTKIIYPLPEKISWAELTELPATVPVLQAEALVPTLVNTYRRSYYQSSDDRFRLTVDWELCCREFRDTGLRWRHFSEQLRVIELKYEQQHDQRLDEFTQYWPLRLDRFSKYVMGMQLVYG